MSTYDTKICDVVCQPEVFGPLCAVTILNVLLFIFNIYMCACPRRRTVSRQVSDHSEQRTRINVQKYISQLHRPTQEASSVVIQPARDHEDSSSPLVLPTVKSLPDTVKCTFIKPHRKLFVGRIEWSNYIGFLKECSNPLETVLHRKLNHENIVSFYWENVAEKPKVVLSEDLDTMDRSKQPPIWFCCMEYCPLGNLAGYLVDRGHTIDRSLLFDLIGDIVAGVHYLHSNKKIAHRDIKSENILVRQEYPDRVVAKLADFDHAIDTLNKFEMSYETRGRRLMFGTPLYMAPEFILDKISEPGAADFFRHDVYSLGLVIWECVTWIKCRQRNRILHQLQESESQRASLLPGPQNELTEDLGQLRKKVKCSSTIHIALIKQICDTLNLKYCPNEKALCRNLVFLREGRLIDTSLMKEFYTKNPDARPTLFKTSENTDHVRYTPDINFVMDGCWREDPDKRLSAGRVLELVQQIIQYLKGTP